MNTNIVFKLLSGYISFIGSVILFFGFFYAFIGSFNTGYFDIVGCLLFTLVLIILIINIFYLVTSRFWMKNDPEFYTFDDKSKIIRKKIELKELELKELEIKLSELNEKP